MEYLLMQTRDGYLEYPVFGRTKEYTQGHTVIHAPYGAGGLRPLRYEYGDGTLRRKNGEGN